MELETLRKQIDEIDGQLTALFEKRMEIAGEVAHYKQKNNLPILDSARERSKLIELSNKTSKEFSDYITILYSLLFELSRSYQGKLINNDTPLKQKILNAIENTEKVFPQNAIVACQGVEGAYSQIACEKIFNLPDIMYFNNFENVFSAINSGMCKYGILPLENSTAGSVNAIYDLMMKYNFNIVRSVRLKVSHNLLAKKGVNIKDIKEIFTHEQAVNQCEAFLNKLNVKVTICENTAVAAKMVADSDRNDVAAISSSLCAKLYNLDCLAESIQDNSNNYTRFICISKNLEIYPGADKTSIMLVLPHKPGSLYNILARFYALSINLIKLESRPLPDSNFEFMFYFDLNTPVYSQQFIQLICELQATCDNFKYLGSYLEIV